MANGDNYGNLKLPEDLLIEIFLRSSVESLLRAKCVCKHWYGLIKVRSFEQNYLEYQKNKKQNRLLLQYFNIEASKYNYAILDDNTQSSSWHHILEHLQVKYDTLCIEGPINGLYCLFNRHDRIVLWNPALRDFKLLPLPPPHFFPHYKLSYGINGFGIDPLTNEHKVVLFRGFFNNLHDYPVYGNPVVTLYSLTTNIWRSLDLGNFDMRSHFMGDDFSTSFINGTYHWWVSSGVVLAFDMCDETFRVIPGPDISEFDGVRYLRSDIAVYEERLALLSCDELLVDIWVMLEEDIWIKQFSIEPLPGLLWPIGFWKNEGIFLVINDSDPHILNPNSRLVLYDVSTQEMRDVGPRATDIGFRTCVYYESLVSLGGGSEHDRDKVSDFLNEAR